MKYKIFKERTSLYEHLAQTNPYIHGLYQVCKVQFTLFLVYLIFRDSYREGRPWLDLRHEFSTFGNLSSWRTFVVLEVLQLILTLLFYIFFQLWSLFRMKLYWVADIFYILVFCVSAALKFYLLYVVVSTGKMTHFHKFSAVFESSIVLMKTISFTYENVYKVLYPWSKDDEQGPAVWYGGQMSPKVASFSQYLYFLVVPTFLYRDHYPRSKGGLRWNSLARRSVQLLMTYLIARVLITEFQYPKSFRFEDIALMMRIIIVASPLICITSSLFALHAVLNLQAELTGFADREFYLNWWSAGGYTEFYRLWNVPVYDFTTFYIYRLLRPYIPRALAGCIVFTLSAFLHDFIMGVTLGFFMPVVLVLFAFLGGIVFATGVKFSKYWTFLFTCLGFIIYQIICYLEDGARRYCPDQKLSLFSLHSPYCFMQHNNVTFSMWVKTLA